MRKFVVLVCCVGFFAGCKTIKSAKEKITARRAKNLTKMQRGSVQQISRSQKSIANKRQLAAIILGEIEQELGTEKAFGKQANLKLADVQFIKAFLQYKSVDSKPELKVKYEALLKKIGTLEELLDQIVAEKVALDDTLNKCNSEPNSVDCDDGRWSINAGLMWNALTPDDGIENVDFAGAVGLNALYLSRWSETSFQIGVNPTSLPKFEGGLRGYGFSILRPEISPFSLSLERRHTPFYRKNSGILYDWLTLGGYVRIGAQRWTYMTDAFQQPIEQNAIAIPAALGWHVFSTRYSTRYHSRLRQKNVQLGPNDGYLELYADFTVAIRSILGDVRQKRREIKDTGSALDQKLGTDFLFMVGPEATAGLRFNKIFVEATYAHLMTDFRSRGSNIGDWSGDWYVKHVPGLTDGQFTIRVGLESELLSLEGAQQKAKPSPTSVIEKSVPKIDQQLLMPSTISTTKLKAHMVKWNTNFQNQKTSTTKTSVQPAQPVKAPKQSTPTTNPPAKKTDDQ